MLKVIPCIVLVLLASIACKQANTNSSKDSDKATLTTTSEKTIVYTKFKGSYKLFKDLHDLHLEAALKKGITPMVTRADTLRYMDKMVRLPNELDIYRIDKLTYSVPYLVPDAANLLVRIGTNFRDSLIRKKMSPYKIIVTSVTRTEEDVKRLTKRNYNASDSSAHTYGTTFDISWKRFEKKGSSTSPDVSPDKLKLVLAEVLHDLRERKQCYIMHERKQACFHITVR